MPSQSNGLGRSPPARRCWRTCRWSSFSTAGAWKRALGDSRSAPSGTSTALTAGPWGPVLWVRAGVNSSTGFRWPVSLGPRPAHRVRRSTSAFPRHRFRRVGMRARMCCCQEFGLRTAAQFSGTAYYPHHRCCPSAGKRPAQRSAPIRHWTTECIERNHDYVGH